MKVEKIVMALFLGALIAVGTSVYYVHENFNEGENSAASAKHAHQVIEMIYQVQLKTLEVENASDKFIRLHSPYYARLTSQYAACLNDDAQDLLDSVKSNPSIAQKVNELKMQIAAMEKTMPGADSMHTRLIETTPNLQTTKKTELSENLISDIIIEINELVNEEIFSLDISRNLAVQSRRNTLTATYYTAGASLLFIFFVLLGLNNDISRRRQAEVKITESEKRLRRVIEEVGDAIYTTDYKRTFTFINVRLETLTGYTANELLGKDSVFLVHPDWIEKVKEFYYHQFKDKIYETRYEFPIITKQGETKWVEQTLVMVKEKKRIKSFQSLVRDITERKEKEEEIRRTNQFLDSILVNIPNMIFIKDGKDFSFIRVNKAAEKLVGHSEEEMIGKTEYDFFPKEQADFFIEKDKEVIKNSKEIDVPEELVNSTQGVRWLHTKKIPVYDAPGIPLYLLEISEDITERKKTEDTIIELNKNLARYITELEESERFYKTIARNFPDGTIAVLDHNLNYIFVDGRELTLEGLNAEELLGTSYLKSFPQEVHDIIENNLTPIFKGSNVSFEIALSGNNYILHGAPLENSSGEINQILLVKQNITKLKQAEENMKAALEKERMINELKSRFVSLASHEFRTPLSTILSSTELIEEYIEHIGQNPALIKDKNIHHLKRIKLAIQNMVNILNSFLSLDQLEQGKTLTIPVKFDITELSMEIIDELEEKLKKEQKIQYSHQSAITSIYTDRSIIKNIILNLLTNAIKYSTENSIIKYTTKASKGGFEFIVEDYGIGIPKTEQTNLFERFFRASNTLNIEGTGLGLSIVKKYIDLLNGHISYTSHEDQGSTFKVFVENITKTDTDYTE